MQSGEPCWNSFHSCVTGSQLTFEGKTPALNVFMEVKEFEFEAESKVEELLEESSLRLLRLEDLEIRSELLVEDDMKLLWLFNEPLEMEPDFCESSSAWFSDSSSALE